MDHMNHGRRLSELAELDPVLDQLCTDIATEQHREIGVMRAWLADNGHAEEMPCDGMDHSSMGGM